MGKLYTSSIDLVVPLLLSKSQGTFPIPHCSVLKPKPSFLPQKALCLSSLSQPAYPELEPLAFEHSDALAARSLPAGLWSLTAFTSLSVRACLWLRNSFHGRERREYYFKSCKNNFELTL